MVGRALLILKTSPSDGSEESSGKEVTISCAEPLDHKEKIHQFLQYILLVTLLTKAYISFSNSNRVTLINVKLILYVLIDV